MPRSRKGNYSTDSDEGSSTGSSEYSHSSRRSDTSSDDEKDRTKGSRGHGSGSESSEEEDWSDEEALRRRRRRKRKRKEQQKQAMYLDYGIGALLLAVVVAGAYTWWQDQASTTTNVPSPSAGSLGATTKATTVKTSSGTLKQSGGALTSKASSKFQSSSSPRPPPSSSKSSPAAPPASSPSQTTAAPPASGGGPYKLIADYSGEKFFNSWSFWDKDDPTHGQVDFLSREDATAANLISASADSAIMGKSSTQRVDNTTTLGPGEFRKSVRIHSTAPITKGSLVIADIRLMPYGCGSWPAWWFHGADWPNGGELDILEGVSLQDVNHITTHVGSSECKLDRSAEVTGTIAADKTECNANLNGNAGCSYIEKSANSYGKAFNDAGGGVFLTLFTEDEVSSWFWSRPDVPQIITDGAPDVSKLGPPSAKWPSSTCASNFWANEQTLIFDITLCGDWAGAQGVWDDGCSDVAPTCLEYVQKADPWTTAVFEVAYVRVYSV